MKGYRTIAFNLIMGAVMFANQMLGTDLDAQSLIGHLNGLEAALMGVWTVGNVWLRAVTDTPIFKQWFPIGK